jgi:hypothetical protein
MNLDNIRELPLADKKTLLAMLQADLGLKVVVEFEVQKPSFYQLETRKCNKVAEIKKSGGSVIYTEFQMVE